MNPYKNSRIPTIALFIALVLAVVISFGVPLVKGNILHVKTGFFLKLGEMREFFSVRPEYAFQEDDIASTIPVLVYHGISDKTDRFTLSRDLFREQMNALFANGYKTITVEDFTLFMKKKKTLPKRSFLLTFDDGRKDSYFGADTILKNLGYTAVMFIAPGQSLSDASFSSEYYLNSIDVKKMIESGRWEIGSHGTQEEGGFIPLDKNGTQGYFLSNEKWLEKEGRMETDREYNTRIQREILSSKLNIERLFGRQVAFISYPFSDYGQQSVNYREHAPAAIRKYIGETYDFAFQQQWPYDGGFVGNHPNDDPHHLRRIETPTHFSGEELVRFLLSGSDIHPVSGGKDISLKSTNRWREYWGKTEITADGTLVLSTDQKQKSSMIVFDGSRAWENYRFTAEVKLKESDSLALYARVERPGVGVRCVFRNGLIVVENVVDGKSTESLAFRSLASSGNHVLSIVAAPRITGCFEDGILAGAIMNPRLGTVGGVGIELWSDKTFSSAEVKNASVLFNPKIDTASIEAISRQNLRSLVSDVPLETLTQSFQAYDPPSHRYAEDIGGIGTEPSLFKSGKWGDNRAVFSSDSAFSVDMSEYHSGEAYWQWPIQSVSSFREYVLSGSYTSTAPSELLIQYEYSDGRTAWSIVQEMPIAKIPAAYEFVVEIPQGVASFFVAQSLKMNGTLAISAPEVRPLKDGSFDKGYVTLSFDDGCSSFKTALPILEKFRTPATLAIITSHTEKKRYLTPSDLANISANGYEVASHTRNHAHLDHSLSYSSLVQEITGSKYDLSQAGFSPKTFVYPYGSFSGDAVAIAKQSGFFGARSVMRGFNTKNTDPFLLKDELIDRTVSLDRVDSLLQKARDEKRWLILEFHNVYETDNPNDSESITVSELESILSLIRENGVEAITLEKGIQKMKAE